MIAITKLFLIQEPSFSLFFAERICLKGRLLNYLTSLKHPFTASCLEGVIKTKRVPWETHLVC